MENPFTLEAGEFIEKEIPASPKTIAYFAVKAAPLFGVWFIGLLIYLIYTYKTNPGDVRSLLFQALALAAFAYLVGIVARWLWRIDVSQRDNWLTNKGIWIQTPKGIGFVSYGKITQVKIKEDWIQKALKVDEIEISYSDQGFVRKIRMIGMEAPHEIVDWINSKMPASVA
jgi:hypothetical protein